MSSEKSVKRKKQRGKRKAAKIEFHLTNRNYICGTFIDHNGAACSIQESSLATEPTLWLGCDDNAPDHLGHKMSPRMHITQAHARALIPLLEQFIHHGRLPLDRVKGAIDEESRS